MGAERHRVTFKIVLEALAVLEALVTFFVPRGTATRIRAGTLQYKYALSLQNRVETSFHIFEKRRCLVAKAGRSKAICSVGEAGERGS